jgi:geranylgeranyl diphosphate synthase, type II
MLNLKDCQVIINRELAALDLPDIPANLYEPIRYILEPEAKRLRPSLVLMSCNVFSDDVEMALYPALAVEVFHNFTLMHDDIMDKAVMRRNYPTVHVKWNENIALLSGDAMLIKAYELLSKTPENFIGRIMPVFNLTALQVCEGQQFDMDYESIPDISIDEYLKMVEYKTAVLLAASLKIGSILGNATLQEAELLYEFGRNLGVAFQLQDDLLDVFADPGVFGKVTGNDIFANKKTILLVEALQRASGKTREMLMKWLNCTEFDRDEKIQAIRSVYEELDLEGLVNEMIGKYHAAALKCLENLPKPQSRKKELLAFSEYLMHRKK